MKTTLRRWVKEYFKMPFFTGFDMALFVIIFDLQHKGLFWFTIPLWLWIIFGSTLIQNKSYTVKEKEEN